MMTCQQLVEIVTDYLEGSLDGGNARDCAAHLEACADCAAYVEQIRVTHRLIGSIPEPAITPAVRAGLLSAFRARSTGHRH